MPDYDFRALSDHDFEILSRDLLQKELGITLESFSRGRDGGIDFRYTNSEKTLVVQCKHYVDYGQLLRTLREKEQAKVTKLKPARYVLAVSTPLTPARKKEIHDLLKPYLNGTGDIYGREDLNNLLGKFSEIEQKSFKLWLTSEPVLNRVLNSGIWLDAELTIQRIQRRASMYVPNPSLGRAREILEKHHHCIVAGIPGIGKTTLAEILLVEYVERQGFEAIRIGNDLSEIKSIKKQKTRQIFYFDDFLGTTALDKLERNEDKRLLEFIDEVALNENWRFLMTTREYILNAALIRYESLSYSSAKLAPCIVELADYTTPIRARILYNHVYFSELQTSYKIALLKEGRYSKIVNHQNYNPRIVEHMTLIQNAEIVAPDLYYQEFLSNLKNPARVWDHAFRNQLGEGAQHLLIVMASLSDQVLVVDLQSAFNSFYQYRRNKHGFVTSSRDFEHALKELDGNFIRTSRIGRAHIVEFHNPSVRDYLELYLAESTDDVADIVQSTVFFDQLQRLWRGKRGREFKGISLHLNAYLSRLSTLISAPVSRLIRIGSPISPIDMTTWEIAVETRAEFILEVATQLSKKETQAILGAIFATIDSRISSGESDRRSLILLLQKLQSSGLHPDQARVLRAAAIFMSQRLNSLDEYENVGRFIKAFPEVLTDDELEILRNEFEEFCGAYDARFLADSPSDLRSNADDIEKIGIVLNVEVEQLAENLRDQAEEWESENDYDPEPEEGFDEDDDDRQLGQIAEPFENMFDRLYESIKDDY